MIPDNDNRISTSFLIGIVLTDTEIISGVLISDKLRKRAPGRNQEFMEWIKIFTDKEEAQALLGENKAQTMVIGGKKICMAISGGQIVAVADRCTHNGESLGKGKINFLGEVVCPWHGYRFDLKTGRCRSDAPDLETFPVKTDATGIFIGV